MLLSSHICTIVLILCIMLLYHKQLYIRTISNKLFERMLYCLVAFSVVNVILLILNDAQTVVSVFMFKLFLRFFCAVLLAYMMSIQDYIFYWLHVELGKAHKLLRIGLCLFVMFLPIDAQSTTSGMRFSGIGVMITGDILLAMLVYLCFVIFVHRNSASYAIKQGMVFFSGVLLLSLFISVIADINFVDFACAIGSFWLFYNIENPKAKVDDVSGFFTTHVILDYIDSLPKQFAHIGVIYTRDDHLDLDLFKSIVRRRKVCCFRDTDSFYYIVSQSIEDIEYVLDHYREKYDVITLTYKNAVSDSFSVVSNYVKQNVSTMNESKVYEIEDRDLSKIVDENQVHLEVINALMEGRITTYIQPIYGIHEKKFVSGECLCRMISPDGTLVPPQDFIPIAERTGLIVEIETIMFRNMCACLSDKRIRKSSIRYLEANLSIKKGEQKELLEEYANILEEYGLQSDKVNLEITETDVVEEKVNILRNMYAMQSMGFNFSLDDFGSGESNLGYIIDMPVSIIKFDKEITQKAMVGERALTVVKSAIDMAHQLKMKVVVEGVETQRDYDMCVALGADYIQGYYFSKPLSIDEFIDFVIDHDK